MRAPDPSRRMSSSWLFWTPTLIWASTWHVILYQLGEVPPVDSVAYRFGLAALLLLAWVVLSRGSLRFTPAEHAALALTGAIQYGVNYLGVYLAERHIPSGLVAVLFTLMVFGNAATGAWFFGQRMSARHWLAATGGVAGVALIFQPEIAATGQRPDAALGLALGLGAVAAAVAGNVCTLKLANRVRPRGVGLPAVLGASMAWGAALLVAVSLAGDGRLQWDARPAYALSLLYLAVFGSVIAFLTYFRLAQREGPARASLTAIVIPVVALAVSATLEGWRPSALSFAGMALSMASLWWATRQEGAGSTAPRRTP
jgi:drug/metabolite transporter (DMT)-like permease